MTTKEKAVMFMLSCDKYSDLWDDFFNLKELFWPDCPYKWYLVTESKDYVREGVIIIKCGKDLDWAGRLRMAVNSVDTSCIGLFLDDSFLEKKVDTSIVEDLVDIMIENKVSFISTEKVKPEIANNPQKEYFREHLVRIPPHTKYGLDTLGALWDKDYLLEKLGTDDYSAWQFEINLCNEALTEEGYNGIILADERLPFNISKVPVVIIGKVYPPSIKHFNKLGYQILTKRQRMSAVEAWKWRLKTRLENAKHGRKIMKWFAVTFMGYEFFTEG